MPFLEQLTKEDVQGIADYARIALNEDELEEMTRYLNSAIEMLEPLREYELSDTEPTFHPIGGLVNVMSEDTPDDVTRALVLDEALKNAASSVGRSFRVPSILGTGEGLS